MNPQVPDELISAYFDGEVSPEERAAVERLLASSDDAQRELNETARLSALLHSFPRESAPVELVGNVLRQTNQLPLPIPSTQGTTAASNPRIWRDWMAGFASAAVMVAAGLLVMVFFVDQPKDHAGATVASNDVRLLEKDPAPEMPHPAAKPSEPVVTLDDRAPLREEMAAKRAIGKSADLDGVERAYEPANQAPLPAPPSNIAARSRQQMRKGSEPGAEVAADAAASGTAAMAKSQAVQALSMDAQENDASELERQEFLRGLRENKFITMSDPENNVGVLMLEVEDVPKSSKLVQGVLKKNSIEPRSASEEGAATSKDYIVFYIKAPGDQLANVVEDVKRHPDLRKMVPAPPLQVASFSDEVNQQAEKKDADIQAKAVNKEKQADKPGAAADEGVPEFQVVLDAFNARNGMANPAYGNSIINSNGQFGGNRDGVDNLDRQSVANAAREKSKAELNVRGGNPAANQAQSGQIGRAGPGYDYARINNSIVTNTAPGGMVNNNSVTPLNQTNPAQNPFQNNGRRQLAYSNQDKAGNNDSNRALRMLFVLHPQADGSQVSPTAVAPAKPQ